jgi:4-aminobutyrate aminotransferase/(S)-3-amino-2-methylpropionate transaminase
LGRSGQWLLSTAEGVIPDVVCLGKGLGGGLPISAAVGREEVMRAWDAKGGGAIHTATHFGAPTACVAALATLDELERHELPLRARTVGDRWRSRLRRALGDGAANHVRGRGLMVGIEVRGGGARALRLSRDLLAAGYIVLTGGARGDVLTLTPALTIEEQALERFTDVLAGLA